VRARAALHSVPRVHSVALRADVAVFRLRVLSDEAHVEGKGRVWRRGSQVGSGDCLRRAHGPVSPELWRPGEKGGSGWLGVTRFTASSLAVRAQLAVESHEYSEILKWTTSKDGRSE